MWSGKVPARGAFKISRNFVELTARRLCSSEKSIFGGGPEDVIDSDLKILVQGSRQGVAGGMVTERRRARGCARERGAGVFPTTQQLSPLARHWSYLCTPFDRNHSIQSIVIIVSSASRSDRQARLVIRSAVEHFRSTAQARRTRRRGSA